MNQEKHLQAYSLDMDNCWNKIGVWGQTDSRCRRLEEFIHCHNCPVYSRAARRLLDRMVPETYVQENTDLLAEFKKIDISGAKSAFVFRIGKEWLAFPSSIIREITAMSRIHKVPHRNASLLKGLVNIRGKLEICVSVGMIIGIQPSCTTEASSNHERLVTIQKDDYCVAFPASEIRGVVHYSPDDISPPPASITGSENAYSKGILRINDIEIGMLDEELFFDTVRKGLI